MGTTHRGNDQTKLGSYNNPILYITPFNNIPNPNPNPPYTPTTLYSTTYPPYNTFAQNTNLLPSNHHLANDGDRMYHEQSKAEGRDQPMSSRWNPTPEQLLVLEEMYRHGVRTPPAEQIQHIAAQLRRFGKIEGKNVFYWFQNHKARERQKRRREVIKMNDNEENPEKKEPGFRKTGCDVEQTKNLWTTSSNCSKLSEEVIASESGPQYNGWTKFDERKEFQQGKSTLLNPPACPKGATWHPVELIPPYCPYHTPKLTLNRNYLMDANHRSETDQTLELFPLHRVDNDQDKNPYISTLNPTDKTDINVLKDNTNSFTPTQYIEFLPLKS